MNDFNPISVRKIVRNIRKYFWILLVCIGVSCGISFWGNNSNNDTEGKVDEYTITLGIERTGDYETLEEKYYSRELQKQILEESTKRVFQTTDKVNSELKKNGYDEIMPTEIPTYSDYMVSDNFITLKVSSINKERALFILKVYQEELSKVCQKIDSECGIEKIAQSSNMKEEQDNKGRLKSILLLFIGGMLGIIIIGFFVLIDDRIYSEKELKACFSFNNFGYIYKEKIQLNEMWIQNYFKINDIKNILFIEEVEKQIPADALRRGMEGYNIYIRSVNDCSYYHDILKSDVVCICITLGKTKISEIRSIADNLNSLGYSINGYLIDTENKGE